MQVHKRLPVATMVEEERCVKRITRSDVALVRGRVDEPAGLVSSGLGRKRQNVLRPFDGLCQENDPESRPFPGLAGREPLRQDQLLIGVVGREFQADAA